MTGHSNEIDGLAEVIRDHRLQPRWRSGDAAPAEDYECLCGEMFWGVAEWSYHVAELVNRPGGQS